MKCVKYALIATLIGGSAIASDLPSRDMPKAPTMPSIEQNSWYTGLALGGVASDRTWYNNARVSASFGYEFGTFLRAEATYDYKHSNRSSERAHTGMVNAIGQINLPFVNVVPYVLAGTGYRLSDVKNEPVWNVGSGVRFEVSPSIELDARFRYLSDFKIQRDENIFTVGVNYKF
jgi:opacity protein-like surface antigen